MVHTRTAAKHRSNVEGDIVIVSSLDSQFVARLVSMHDGAWRAIAQERWNSQFEEYRDATRGESLDLDYRVVLPRFIVETVAVSA